MTSASRTLSRTVLQPLQYALDLIFFVIGIAFLLRFAQEFFPLARFDVLHLLPRIQQITNPALASLRSILGISGGIARWTLPLGVSVVAWIGRFIVIGLIKSLRLRFEEPAAEGVFAESKGKQVTGMLSSGIEFADSEDSRAKLLRDLREIEKKLKGSVDKRCTFLSVDVVGSTAMKTGKSQTDIAASFQAYEEMLRKIFDKFGVWKQAWTPDGVMVCFLQRDLAVGAGIRLLHSLRKFNERDNRLGVPFTVRAGINEGEVAIYDDSKLEKVADHAIDVAGHMQKHCGINCLWLSNDVYNQLADKTGWMATNHVVDGYRVCEWALEPRSAGAPAQQEVFEAEATPTPVAVATAQSPNAVAAPAQSRSATHSSGSRIGRYEIIEELGRGSMGAVFRARDPQIGRIVAIKVILTRDLGPAELQQYKDRFYREAQAAGKMQHPGIITVHDLGEDESGSPYLVMEYVEGRTLDLLVGHNAEERLPVSSVLDLAIQVADALDYAHRQHVVHRDIKPANIMVTPDGRAKIADFGIAKIQGTQFTMAGQVLGTPAYMSPEQLTGTPVDARSDLFSFGVVLYWLLSGEKPFAADTITAITYKVVNTNHLPVRQLNPAVPVELEQVLDRCLAKEASGRYETAKDLAADLRAIQAGMSLTSATA